MKKTFSAYVRLSQTRTREPIQAAFQVVRAGRSRPCPARGEGGTRNRRARTGVGDGSVGAIIGQRAGFSATAVLRIPRTPSVSARRPVVTAALLYAAAGCVLVEPVGSSGRGTGVRTTADGSGQLLAI